MEERKRWKWKVKYIVGIALWLVSVFLFLSWLCSDRAHAMTFGRSSHTMVTHNNIVVLPVNGRQTNLPVYVVTTTDWQIAPGSIVNCIFQEFWRGELDSFGISQSVEVAEDGWAKIPVPPSTVEGWRYATLWVDGELASVEHKMFLYTTDYSMPAQIVPLDVPASLALGENYPLQYWVVNAWGQPLPNVKVKMTWGGREYVTSPEVATTDASGIATFNFTAPGGNAGNSEVRAQIEPWSFLQTATMISWSGSNPTPTPAPEPTTGEVASIEAVNATSYDGGRPVWTTTLGQSVSMTFVAKDSSGNPVSGAQLSVLYPSTNAVTDSNGQVSITSPTSQYTGWDDSKIWVSDDESVYLEFIVYYK